MSYPYTLDLDFGSEQSTADAIGRLSFVSSNGGGGGTGGDKTNSFLVSTLLYDSYKYSPSPEEYNIDNRFILELDPFQVDGTTYEFFLDLSLRDAENYSIIAPKSILDSLTYEFVAYSDTSSTTNKFRIACIIKQGDTIIVQDSLYKGRRDLFFGLSLNGIVINGKSYSLRIIGLSRVTLQDGTVNYNNNYNMDVDNIDLGYSKKNYNYVTNIHLENTSLEIIDTTRESEIKSWWESKPIFSSEPYPLTVLGDRTTLVSNPSYPEGVAIMDLTITGMTANIYLIDLNSHQPVACISGDVVFDNPSDVVLPLSLPKSFIPPVD